jgi:hypothetical protein
LKYVLHPTFALTSNFPCGCETRSHRIQPKRKVNTNEQGKFLKEDEESKEKEEKGEKDEK